ncbi:hypothetical protein ACOMHN_010560 [Nucella lapillus]
MEEGVTAALFDTICHRALRNEIRNCFLIYVVKLPLIDLIHTGVNSQDKQVLKDKRGAKKKPNNPAHEEDGRGLNVSLHSYLGSQLKKARQWQRSQGLRGGMRREKKEGDLGGQGG